MSGRTTVFQDVAEVIAKTHLDLRTNAVATEADVKTFIWLSAEERERVLAKFHSPGVKEDYLNNVKLQGSLLQFRYKKPDTIEMWKRVAELSKDVEEKLKELLTPQEWGTPAVQDEAVDPDDGDDDYEDSPKKEPFEGIIPLDEPTKEIVEQLSKELIEWYLRKIIKSDPDHPLNNLEGALAEEQEVNRLLILAGYPKPEKLSKCARAGLIRGHFGFKFTGDPAQLDTVVSEAKCSEFSYDEKCPGTLKATVRKLLKQPDYAGIDYIDSGDAPVKCELCGQGQYLSRCCSGYLDDWDSGKAHNHCRKCPGLGLCIRDYKFRHCKRCSGHFFYGFINRYPCPCEKVFRMISKAKEGDRAALAALYFYKDDESEYEEEEEEEEEDYDGSDWTEEYDSEDGGTEDDLETHHTEDIGRQA